MGPNISTDDSTSDRGVSGPLAGVTVLDLVQGTAGAYATRLLVWLGADVIRVEPPGGDPLRTQLPFRADAEAAVGLRYEHFNLGTRSIVLDLECEHDRGTLRELAERSEVLVENRPVGTLAAADLGAEALLAANPRLVYTSITPFGQTGPRAHWQGTDIVSYATGGMMFLTGDADGPPMRLGASAADHLSGLYAVFATLAALSEVTTSGRGQHVDVSAQEAVASTIVDAGVTYYQFNDRLNPRRVGTEHPMIVPSGAFPARDGWVQINGLEPHMFRAAIKWTGEAGIDVEVFDDPELDAPIERLPLRELVHLLVAEATSQFDKLEIYEQLQGRGVPCGPFSEIGDLASNPQLLSRSFFESVASAVCGRDVTVPGPPFRMSRTALRPASPAPARDGDRESILGRAWGTHAPAPQHLTRHGRAWGTPRALTGIRVIDFSWALAGPWGGRVLAAEGAEVIRVESGKRLDGLRRMAPHPDRSGSFINANAGKLGLSLDLSSARAIEIVKGLVARADVVLDNFRPGVMARMGLGEDQLRECNPQIITCSMPAQGETGPHADFVAYAPVLMALSGHNTLTGEADSRPTSVAIGYIDQVAGVMAAIGILAAIRHRDRTGEGQHIELSQFEAAVGMLDSAPLEYFALGVEPPRQGNRSSYAAPQGCYPCRDDDRWVVISIEDDRQWAGLCRTIGREDLGTDAELATQSGRRGRHDEIDRAITAWTQQHQPQEAMSLLQGAGVPAGAVQTVEDMLEHDEHLRARGFYERIEHPVMGDVWLERGGATLTRTPGGLCGRGGPALGEHNEALLEELLGIAREQFEQLRDDGVVDSHLVPGAVDTR